MGAWVPGRAVPGCLGRSPGPLGHVPGGSQGGCPGPMSEGQTALLEFASKIMSILMSIFGRLGVHLGSLLGVIFGHVGALFGPNWSRNRLRIDLSSKK